MSGIVVCDPDGNPLFLEKPGNSPLSITYKLTEGTPFAILELSTNLKLPSPWTAYVSRCKYLNWFMKDAPSKFEFYDYFSGPTESKEEAKICLDNHFKELQEEGIIATYTIGEYRIP